MPKHQNTKLDYCPCKFIYSMSLNHFSFIVGSSPSKVKMSCFTTLLNTQAVGSAFVFNLHQI